MSKYTGRWRTVQVDVEHGIGRIPSNRPEQRNHTCMARALCSASANPGVLRCSLPIC